jgi:transcriptional regulator with XRE-family HTH domain
VEQKNIVGSRVQQARKDANPPITQLDLVARLELLGLKVDQSIISKIETGQRPVLDFEVIDLAKALKVSASWLLEGDKCNSAI